MHAMLLTSRVLLCDKPHLLLVFCPPAHWWLTAGEAVKEVADVMWTCLFLQCRPQLLQNTLLISSHLLLPDSASWLLLDA